MAQNEVSCVNVAASPELVTFINSAERSDAQILRKIESLSVSADAKALLADLLKLATRVGQVVLRVGRKIIEFATSRRVCVTLPQNFPGWLHDTATLGSPLDQI